MARPRSVDKRTKRLTAPASMRELNEFNAACLDVRMEPADTLRKLAASFVEHVKGNGFVVQPIKLAGPPEVGKRT